MVLVHLYFFHLNTRPLLAILNTLSFYVSESVINENRNPASHRRASLLCVVYLCVWCLFKARNVIRLKQVFFVSVF